MEDARFKYLATYVLGGKEFKELAEEFIKRYSRQSPHTEIDTVKMYERVRFLQELLDIGETNVRNFNEREK